MNRQQLAKKGRFGDTEIRNIDDKPAHVNKYEASLIDDHGKSGEIFVKEIGSGTINPETGLKEHFIGAALAAVGGIKTVVGAVGAGVSAYSAWKQQKSANEAADQAAGVFGDIKQEKLGMLGEQKDLATTSAWNQYSSGLGDISSTASTQYGQTIATQNQAMSKAGFAGSGTIDRSVENMQGDIQAKYMGDMKKLVDTRSIATSSADLAFRKGELSAEEAYHQSMSAYQKGDENLAGITAGISAGAQLFSAFGGSS